nr:TnsA endonuclease N-terminal domain-containing protein [Bacillus sp. 123MFChir2]
MERNYFYLTEFSDVVSGIREQIPLLPQEELGIKHPADPKTGDPIVMTTDFLLTVDIEQIRLLDITRGSINENE